ncbi:MAG: HAD-IB family hydrolase [Deltaproteobacteria bacterium]|nr:HAD-IB family hydrolase [Deltaproteobacteria bacterium]
MPTVAFFDVDDTLWRGNSGYYTSLRLVRHGILKKRRVLQAVYYKLADLFARQDVHKIYKIAIADMAGMKLTHALEIGTECFEKDMKRRLHAEAVAKVQHHRQRGDRIILLTSGPYMTIHSLQAFLKTDDYYASGPKVVDGTLINDLKMPLSYGEGKLHYAREASQKYGVPLSTCYFYSNDLTDLPLFENVGYPHVVNPKKELRKIAEQKGWPILRFD